MNKSDLIKYVSEKNDISLLEAESAVNALFDSMIDTLKKGGRVELRGFGSFCVREYDAYMGRNPKTGDIVNVPPKRLPFFKVGKDMRLSVDKQ